MLAPRWADDAATRQLRDVWRADRCARVASVLAEAHAARFLGGARAADYVADARDGCQLWRYGWEPGTGCDHALCVLGRWLWGDGMAWVAGLTGRALAAPQDRQLVCDAARKGSFFEAYDDAGEGRALAFQLHLTPGSWPAAWGGHLERLRGGDGPVVDRWAPAWNTLDLFDVSDPGQWRRMPLLTRHVEGYTVSGWYGEKETHAR